MTVIAVRSCSIWLDCCNSLLYGLLDTLLHQLHSVQMISRRYCANSIGYPSESVSSSKWHIWFASCCPGRWLLPYVQQHSALCGQLTFRPSWYRSAVTATELLQPLDLACGTLFRSSCTVQTSPTDCWDNSWKHTFFGKPECGALWLLIYCALGKHLTYLPRHVINSV